ncbi:ATP-dependent DNA helicase 2 subunit ku70-like protein, partial [Trifolium pratense]
MILKEYTPRSQANTTKPTQQEEGNKEDEAESHFQIALSSISHSLKAQIINKSYDQVAICFFNTRERKNLQDLNGVYVFNVADRDYLDRPTARLIKEFDNLEESFSKNIGSQHGVMPGTRENPLYNAIWVAQALLRKGSAKTVDKRILLFTNEDDPFGRVTGAIKSDMTRTTLQRAKDTQDLGITIELLPLSCPNEIFDISKFYADLIGLEGDDLVNFMASAGNKLEDMKDQLRKRMFTKRRVNKFKFTLVDGVSIDLNSYALIRPTVPGSITWLDSVTNRPLKSERNFFCADTGALVEESTTRFHPYKSASKGLWKKRFQPNKYPPKTRYQTIPPGVTLKEGVSIPYILPYRHPYYQINEIEKIVKGMLLPGIIRRN